jgi:anti-sigma regulatory factor (Ser/Thr protein kinase)
MTTTSQLSVDFPTRIAAFDISSPSAMDDARGCLLVDLIDAGYDAGDCHAVLLALTEALDNAWKHGRGNNPGIAVRASYEVTARTVSIVVTDSGSGFTRTGVADPTHTEFLAAAGGRGLLLIRSFMHEVHWNEQGNEVRMSRHRRRAA